MWEWVSSVVRLSETIGVSAALTVVIVVALVSHILRENRRVREDDMPPWVRGMKRHFCDHITTELQGVKHEIREELKESTEQARERDRRQQAMHLTLTKIESVISTLARDKFR